MADKKVTWKIQMMAQKDITRKIQMMTHKDIIHMMSLCVIIWRKRIEVFTSGEALRRMQNNVFEFENSKYCQ